MIGKLRGLCGGKDKDGTILLDVGGVGYSVRVPLGIQLSLQEGMPLELFIHTAVREDAIDLYGFETSADHSFFKLLTSVSGVGPKTALGVLNVADVQSLKRAVAAGDATALTKVYGVGKKSAERIIVELRDKLSREADLEGAPVPQGFAMEVIEALMALGYSAQESRKALQGIPQEITGVREQLAAALKHLGSPSPASS